MLLQIPYIDIYTYIYISVYTVGKTLFDPLLILYVYPLTKKLSVYNFNGRFIWKVRDRITTITKSRQKHFTKSCTLICILMSQISICLSGLYCIYTICLKREVQTGHVQGKRGLWWWYLPISSLWSSTSPEGGAGGHNDPFCCPSSLLQSSYSWV